MNYESDAHVDEFKKGIELLKYVLKEYNDKLNVKAFESIRNTILILEHYKKDEVTKLFKDIL